LPVPLPAVSDAFKASDAYRTVPSSPVAEGRVATVYVGTLMSPMKPSVDVTGPENVVEAILIPLAQGFA
jgi:hypothetical protein